MMWNTEFFFGQPFFRDGLLTVAGFLDVGDKVRHFPQNINIYKSYELFLTGRKFPSTIKRDLFIP